MKVLKTIYADEGMILTNDTIYGKQIALAEGANEFDFYEITEESYQEILALQEQEHQRMI